MIASPLPTSVAVARTLARPPRPANAPAAVALATHTPVCWQRKADVGVDDAGAVFAACAAVAAALAVAPAAALTAVVLGAPLLTAAVVGAVARTPPLMPKTADHGARRHRRQAAAAAAAEAPT